MRLPQPFGRQAAVTLSVCVLLVLTAIAIVPAFDGGPDDPGAQRGQGAARSAAARCAPRPYDKASPWNREIGRKPTLDPRSAAYLKAIADNEKPITSDPDQYTPALYHIDRRTPRRTVKLSGWYSSYDAGDNSRVGHGEAPTIRRIPIPEGAVAPAGDDAQIILWNPAARVEYAFWQFERDAGGNYTATNGYRYHTGRGYHGRFADGLAGRGAGLPYLAGLVRRCEIKRGRVKHALAFAYDAPAGEPRYPASKSDGDGMTGVDLPEGTRLQLDPSLTNADFDRWNLPRAARIIARALQTYGMYVVDNSGSSKIFLEARHTARWNSAIGPDLVSGIPWKAFRVVAAPRKR